MNKSIIDCYMNNSQNSNKKTHGVIFTKKGIFKSEKTYQTDVPYITTSLEDAPKSLNSFIAQYKGEQDQNITAQGDGTILLSALAEYALTHGREDIKKGGKKAGFTAWKDKPAFQKILAKHLNKTLPYEEWQDLIPKYMQIFSDLSAQMQRTAKGQFDTVEGKTYGNPNLGARSWRIAIEAYRQNLLPKVNTEINKISPYINFDPAKTSVSGTRQLKISDSTSNINSINSSSSIKSVSSQSRYENQSQLLNSNYDPQKVSRLPSFSDRELFISQSVQNNLNLLKSLSQQDNMHDKLLKNQQGTSHDQGQTPQAKNAILIEEIKPMLKNINTKQKPSHTFGNIFNTLNSQLRVHAKRLKEDPKYLDDLSPTRLEEIEKQIRVKQNGGINK